MTILIGLAVGLIVGGLIICYLSPGAQKLSTLFWWVGIILAVIGLILLITPVLIWVDTNLRAMLGH